MSGGNNNNYNNNSSGNMRTASARHSAIPISPPATASSASVPKHHQRSSLQHNPEQSASAGAVGVNEETLDRLCDVLPQASREVLARYLVTNRGVDSAAITAYLEDERVQRVP
jgi:hypothetical protein